MKILFFSLIFVSSSLFASVDLAQYQKTIEGTYCLKNPKGIFLTELKFKITTAKNSSWCKVESLDETYYKKAKCQTQFQTFEIGPMSLPVTTIGLFEGENGEDAWGLNLVMTIEQSYKDIKPILMVGFETVQDGPNEEAGPDTFHRQNFPIKDLAKWNPKTKKCDVPVVSF
jgi:hypothetical protein